MLPSANRSRDQEPGRDVGREQASAGGEDDAIADSVHETRRRELGHDPRGRVEVPQEAFVAALKLDE